MYQWGRDRGQLPHPSKFWAVGNFSSKNAERGAKSLILVRV